MERARGQDAMHGLPVPLVVLVMGVSGSGKTTIGRLLVDEMEWSFQDAGEFHPLTNEDRLPWLRQIRRLIRGWIEAQRPVVLIGSALMRRYREILLDGVEDRVRLVYLQGSEMKRFGEDRLSGAFGENHVAFD